MAYFIDLFSPETYEAFARSPRGHFRLSPPPQEHGGKNQTRGCVRLLSHKTLSLVRATRSPQRAVHRRQTHFRQRKRSVRGSIPSETHGLADIDKGIPIHDDAIWGGLSFTRGQEKYFLGWTGKVRGSLVRLDDRDGSFLAEKLTAQAGERRCTHSMNRTHGSWRRTR